MVVQQLYTNCLSEAAYFIASEGQAAIVDPIRDVEEYIELAKQHGAEIKYIFETHFHADFVSGHLELAAKTGATIVYGPNTKASFDFHKAEDGELFTIGDLRVKAIHTPGHTLESTCYLLFDGKGEPYCVFTGDTLFVGDVGRPDLFSGNLSKEELAGMLYDSLDQKLKKLPDHVIVYPAHGPGSACGKNLGKETFSTIGAQKASNYALQDQSKEEFVRSVTKGLAPAPAYFPINAKLNAKGYKGLDEVLEDALKPLGVESFEEEVKKGAIILDVRPPTVFTESFIPQSINIGIDGRFAEWAGSLLPYDKSIVIVAGEGKEREAIIRLARVGLDNVVGYLAGGFEAWLAAGKPSDMIVDITAEEFGLDLRFDKKMEIIDVRKPNEFDQTHVAGAELLPLSDLTNPLYIAQLDEDKNMYVHCAGGYRSVIACSLMKREGFHNVRNILGGFAEIKKQEEIPLNKEK